MVVEGLGKVPVQTHPETSKNEASKFLVPGEDWELVSDGHEWAEGLAITDDGTLYITRCPRIEALPDHARR